MVIFLQKKNSKLKLLVQSIPIKFFKPEFLVQNLAKKVLKYNF